MKARFFRSDAAADFYNGDLEKIIESKEGFQLTYDALRGIPNGECIAFINADGYWQMDTSEDETFSDVVFFTEEVTA